jgi:hypothetical protein
VTITTARHEERACPYRGSSRLPTHAASRFARCQLRHGAAQIRLDSARSTTTRQCTRASFVRATMVTDRLPPPEIHRSPLHRTELAWQTSPDPSGRYPTGRRHHHNQYDKAIRVSDTEMAALSITPANFHGECNYAFRPRPTAHLKQLIGLRPLNPSSNLSTKLGQVQPRHQPTSHSSLIQRWNLPRTIAPTPRTEIRFPCL